MEKSILIEYRPEGDERLLAIPLLYEMEDTEDIQTIRCKVNMPFGEIPGWLKPHKFEVRAIYDGNSYQALLNETGGVHTLDAALFMEKAQQEVCIIEKRGTQKRRK
jgi:hypothetical protein